jgi:hypothetical protein
MITAANYVEWTDITGLYLGNVSDADRYRVIQSKISRAGFVTRVVHDFLRDSDGGIDLQRWRNMDIPEIGDDAAFRIEETAKALEAIGAPRIAAKMRTVRDTSLGGQIRENLGSLKSMDDLRSLVNPMDLLSEMRGNLARHFPGMAAQAGLPIPEKKSVPLDPDIEPFEQVELLLTKYVQAHQPELQADLDKHGDVRQQPGFDPELREQELEAMRRQAAEHGRQRDDLQTMQEHQRTLARTLDDRSDPADGWLSHIRRQYLEAYRRWNRQPPDALLPELRAWLPEAEAFQQRYPSFFRPQPTTNPALLKRLAEFGAYETDTDQFFQTITWDAPNGFECDWTRFALTLALPPTRPELLVATLEAAERLRRRFSKVQAKARKEVLESFDCHRDQLADFELEDYEVDDDGAITEESILKNANGGNIRVQAAEWEDDVGLELSIFFGVEWDEEHGLEVHVQDRG